MIDYDIPAFEFRVTEEDGPTLTIKPEGYWPEEDRHDCEMDIIRMFPTMMLLTGTCNILWEGAE